MGRFRAYASDDSNSSDDDDRISTGKPVPQTSSAQASKGTRKLYDDVGDSELSENDSGSSGSSSEMDEDELMLPPTQRQNETRHRGRISLGEEDNITYASDVRVHVSPPSSSGLPSPPRNRVNGDPSIIPWAQHIGVDAQKMHVMQTSLFRMPEEAAALKALNQPTKKPVLPKNINLRTPLHTLNRKHSRESDGDVRLDFRERASFAHDIDPPVYRPSRKYARVENSSSLINGHEGSLVDAGLSLGRSFRVSWGPGGTLAHLGSICGPASAPSTSANMTIIHITNVITSLTSHPNFTSWASSSTALSIATKLLQHHLSHTPILPDDLGIPFADPPSPYTPAQDENTDFNSSKALNFASFSALFPTADTTHPAIIFRLGSALFDPIDLHLGGQKKNQNVISITPEIRNRVTLLRRKTALGKWLEESVKPSVDSDLRLKASGFRSGTYIAADSAFTHLTGHQVEQACASAGDGGYTKLATLIAQAGGDLFFKEDIKSQLRVWKSEKIDYDTKINDHGLIGRGVWKVYALLGGLPDEGEMDLVDEEDLYSGLDWKRIFGLCLWYGEGVDASITDVLRVYEGLMRNSVHAGSKNIAKPIPSWVPELQKKKGIPEVSLLSWSSTPTSYSSNPQVPEDALYSLIRMHADPSISLKHTLNPLSFSVSGMDWGVGLCWHLYIILSRVMRVRDFADRGDPVTRKPKINGFTNGIATSGDHSSDDETITVKNLEREEGTVEGHSPTADLLASSYAFQLESWGLVQEAAFVLLHLEGSTGREKAIKDLLSRSAPRLDEWMTRGIVGSLKLPMAWVNEAKALYSMNQGEIYSAYESYLLAGLYHAAHDLAVLELAPDAIIRKDLQLLQSLFECFNSEGRIEKIPGWFVRGKVFLDYVHIMDVLSKYKEQCDIEKEEGIHAVPDAAQAQEVEETVRRIPKLIGILPDVLYRTRQSDIRHAAALEEMVKELLFMMEKVKPVALSQVQQPTLSMVDGAIKLDLVRGTGYARFLSSINT